jgi:hypothetical protein
MLFHSVILGELSVILSEAKDLMASATGIPFEVA